MGSFSIWFFGLLSLPMIGMYRSIRSEGWDDSNVLNWLRMFSLLVLYPSSFAGLYRLSDDEYDYLTMKGFEPVEPFDFMRKDEFSENFPKSRQ
jgi:hypothetical protein